MTTHSISSGVNKQVLDETLDIIFICARLLFIYLFASRNEPTVIKAAVSAQRSPKSRAAQRAALSTFCAFFFYIVIREKYVLPFPRGFPGTVSQCERAPWGCLGQFSFNKVFLFCFVLFFVSIVTTLLCCFADFPAVLLRCLKSNAVNLWLNSSETSSPSWQA